MEQKIKMTNDIINTATFNVAIAKSIGVEPAVLLQELFNQCENNNLTLTVDCDILFNKTALDKQKQQICMSFLEKQGLINVDKHTNSISLNLESVTDMLLGKPKKTATDFKQNEKSFYIRKTSKKAIKHIDSDIDRLIENWIDSLVDKFGYCNQTIVENG